MNQVIEKLAKAISDHGKTRKEWYREVYLKSDHWFNLRKAAKAKFGPKCAKCNASKKVDVHHLEYRNIFDVTVDDLQILCRNCHDLEHLAIEA